MECWMPTGKTVVCGIIGDPIEHTMSPAMHNAAFRAGGLDWVYVPFRVDKDDVGKAIAGMRALNVRGFNITIPHKVAAIPHLDKIDAMAEKIGAVNTVVNEKGILTGYNTDASGFLQALLEAGIKPAGKKIVILGAGGASRAISFILAEQGAEIIILNRREELDWAVSLASNISLIFNRMVKALEMNARNLPRALEGADVLVNATSVGMHPHTGRSPINHELLREDIVVYDIIYNPVKTRLMKDAGALGAKTIGGLDMLVWQGALAFKLWTGQDAPVALMKQEALRLLHEK